MDTFVSVIEQLKNRFNLRAYHVLFRPLRRYVPREKFLASLQVGKLEKWTNKSEALNWITKFQVGSR